MDEARESPSIYLHKFSGDHLIKTLFSDYSELCQQLYLIYLDSQRQFREIISQGYV